MSPRAITYAVNGENRVGGEYVTAPDDEHTVVDFSDGTEVTLAPDTRLRVRDTYPSGAVLILERGSVTMNVIHRRETRWQLWAGPYAVDVVGTRLSTDWDPARERLQVEVETGAVRVSGGAVTDPVLVRSGQRLTASTRDGAWTVGQPAASGPPRPPADKTSTSGAVGTEPAPPPTRAATRKLDWAQAIARGEFEDVVTSAQTFGVQRCIDTCSPADLRRLADAARYTNRFTLARDALLALRRRDPSQRAVAAFLLATVCEPQGRTQSALSYYDTYLREAPEGSYAQEARLARLRILDGQGSTTAARRAASEYLARYPNGAGTKLARQVLRAPRATNSAAVEEISRPPGTASGSPGAGSR